MTDFETSCYYKDGKKIIGAEVRIYNDEGNTIDRILITDAHGLEELENKLDTLDDTYIDKNELIDALKDNVFDGYDVIVNANTFDGHDSSYYATTEHNHSGQFAPTMHQSNTASTYGAGTEDQYGHVKVRDDLNARSLNVSESLSSHQGYELNQRLTKLETDTDALKEQYYANSMRIKMGRWSSKDEDPDRNGENSAKIEVMYGSGDGVYAKLYCDKPGYKFEGRSVILVVNGVPYARDVDSTGRTGKLNINLNRGNYLLDAFVRGGDGVNAANDTKILIVK